MTLSERPRRLRQTPALRRLVRETRVSRDALVLPLFVREGVSIRENAPGLAGLYRYSPDRIPEAVETALTAGINAFLLFGIPAHKDREGSEAWREDGIVQQALKTLRSRFPEVILITDVCLCEYTSHGHCGVLTEAGLVDNDQTLPLLAMTARSQAEAGADLVAPSDMMDGRVAAIRQVLDQKGLTQVGIMSYAVKYASSFYRPFRDTAGSRPAQGDRRNYQMDWHNRREASREAALDQAEGADILMVKPALAYLDVVAEVAATANRPVAAYSVSGEYAMLQAAAAAGLLDLEEAIAETAAGVFRAGADILVSYFAPEIATAIKRGDLG